MVCNPSRGAPFLNYLTKDNDGSTISMNLNGSSTPQKAWVQPSSGEEYEVDQISIHVRDAGVHSAVTLGAIAALTNGLLFETIATDGTTVKNTLFNVPIKNNGQLLLASDVHANTSDWATSAYFVQSTIKFPRPIVLQAGERLQLTVQDDCSALTDLMVITSGTMRVV